MPRKTDAEGGKYYTPEELIEQCRKYIEAEGMEEVYVGLNFSETVYAHKRVIVTLGGLCEYLDVHSEYITQLTRPASNKDKASRAEYSRSLARIKQMLGRHNDRGNSIGEISNKSYAIWKAAAQQETERVKDKLDEDEQKQRIKRMKIENKHLEQRLASEIDWKQSRTEMNDVKADQERARADKAGTIDNIEYNYGGINEE